MLIQCLSVISILNNNLLVIVPRRAGAVVCVGEARRRHIDICGQSYKAHYDRKLRR